MISPFWADFNNIGKLPPALFTCGTLDCLLDDSVLMSAKWMASGAEAVLKVYPGEFVRMKLVVAGVVVMERAMGMSGS